MIYHKNDLEAPAQHINTTPSWKRAFTLIELLVVVAIIGIIMAMLMPALSEAREKGRRTACLSQLHQIITAVELYRADNDDWLAPVKTGSFPDVKLFSDKYQAYLETEQIWLCPSGDPSPPVIGSANGEVLHYGNNYYDYDDVDGDGINNHLSGTAAIRVRNVAEPSEAIHIADSDPTSSPENIGGAQNGTTDWPLTSLAEARHSNGYNVVKLGGSARWYPNKPNHEEWAVRQR